MSKSPKNRPQASKPEPRWTRPWFDRGDAYLMISIGTFLILVVGIMPSCQLRDFPITDAEIIWSTSVCLAALLMILGSVWFLRWRK